MGYSNKTFLNKQNHNYQDRGGGSGEERKEKKKAEDPKSSGKGPQLDNSISWERRCTKGKLSGHFSTKSSKEPRWLLTIVTPHFTSATETSPVKMLGCDASQVSSNAEAGGSICHNSHFGSEREQRNRMKG